MLNIFAIVGATASGKSDLALYLAQKYNGEIVSCDSVQIYKEFSIGSAKPSAEELALVPHHLIDTLKPTEECNAGKWRDLAMPIVEDITYRGRVPILVGGTGLYLKSLFLGMFDSPSRDQEYREHLQKIADKEGVNKLFQELKEKDPQYAEKISQNDVLRIVRALEAIYVTKIPFSKLHLHNTKPHWHWHFMQPAVSREQIYKNIELRVDKMFEMGLKDEVEGLLNRYNNPMPAMNTIGYHHMKNFLDGTWTWEEMRSMLILDTRHFAKRQLSLFRSLLAQEKIYSLEEIEGVFNASKEKN